jgi:hypothetical protein
MYGLCFPESKSIIQISNNKVFRAYLAVFTVTLSNSLAEIVYKSSHKEKIRRSKNSTVPDRKTNFLSDTVEFFLIAGFFRGELSWANSRYPPQPYSFYGGVTGYCHSGAWLR